MPSVINATTTNGVTVQGDNSGSLQLATNNGTTAVTIDTSQKVGIGTASPSYKLHVANGYGFFSGANYGVILGEDNCLIAGTSATLNSANMVFYTANTERMRIDSSGNLLVGTTATSPGYGNTNTGVQISGSGSMFSRAATDYTISVNNNTTDAGNYRLVVFRAANLNVGNISSNGTGVTYGTASDYRLKENIVPMVGALAKVAALNPVTYTWKVNGSVGEGFIAHELQEVVPDAVVGEKDAVETYTDEDGNEQTRIKPQGIDTSFLVATLTAAIQELNTDLANTKLLLTEVSNKVEAQAVRIAELEGAK